MFCLWRTINFTIRKIRKFEKNKQYKIEIREIIRIWSHRNGIVKYCKKYREKT